MARIELPTEIKNVTPLYALVGAGDLTVEKLRAISGRLADLRDGQVEPKAVAGEVGARAGDAYDDLAKRGKSLVTRIRNQQATQELQAQATTTVRRTKAARTTAKRSAVQTRTVGKGAVTSARKTTRAAARAVEDGAAKVG